MPCLRVAEADEAIGGHFSGHDEFPVSISLQVLADNAEEVAAAAEDRFLKRGTDCIGAEGPSDVGHNGGDGFSKLADDPRTSSVVVPVDPECTLGTLLEEQRRLPLLRDGLECRPRRSRPQRSQAPQAVSNEADRVPNGAVAPHGGAVRHPRGSPLPGNASAQAGTDDVFVKQ